MKSEFGKGFTYCLGMFLAHKDTYFSRKISYKGNKILIDSLPSIWFNASSDHLYELQIPENFPEKLKKRLNKFQDKVLDFGHGSGLFNNNVTEKDVLWSCDEALYLLRAIDKEIGVKVEKGGWE